MIRSSVTSDQNTSSSLWWKSNAMAFSRLFSNNVYSERCGRTWRISIRFANNKTGSGPANRKQDCIKFVQNHQRDSQLLSQKIFSLTQSFAAAFVGSKLITLHTPAVKSSFYVGTALTTITFISTLINICIQNTNTGKLERLNTSHKNILIFPSSLYLFEQCLELGVTSTSCVYLPL